MPVTKISLGRQTDLNATSQKIINVLNPTADQDVATKSYVDAFKTGLDVKDSVRVATTANGTFTTAFANGSVVDGVTLATGDRILIKDQTDATQNGIYTVNATGAPTRATDADSNTEVTSGMFTFVEEGTTNDNGGYVLSTNGAITLGTTSLSFTLFSQAGQITGGAGLTRTGNSLDVGAGDGIQVDADSVTVKLNGSSLTKSASGLKVTQGTAGQVQVTNAGATDVVPTTLSGDVASVSGAGVVTLAGTITREADFVDRETPAGTINGSNTSFTLSNTPIAGSEHVYLNGLLQDSGAGNDYTISGLTITYLTAPVTGDKLRVTYRK